jgi:hypothetical protein
MEQLKKIALVVCYHGKFPWYFSYFFHTCKYNPSIDFFLVTDQPVDQTSLSENVKFIPKTFDEICSQINEKLNLETNIKTGYKLCDFKPAYGLIFEDLLKDYDFWGHCDTDVVFGNIREFITNDVLEGHDLISVRPDWIPGCFLLFRNCEKMNTLFKKSKDYIKVYTSEEYHNFDETSFAHNLFKSGMHYSDIHTPVESMLHVIKKLEEEGYINPLFDFFMIEGLSGRMLWQEGRLYYKNKFEVLLYHMMYLKVIYNPNMIGKRIPDSFSISPTRIYRHKRQYIEI